MFILHFEPGCHCRSADLGMDWTIRGLAAGVRLFLSLFKTLIPPLGPIQPLVQGIRCLWPGREDDHSPTSGPEMKNEWSYTPISLICLYRGYSDDFGIMRRLTTGIRSEKRVVSRFRRCPNVIECTYTNFETWYWLGLLMDERPSRHPFPQYGGFIHIEDLLW
jgi:hypothetical protein